MQFRQMQKKQISEAAQTHLKNSDCSCWDFNGRCFRKQLMSIKSFLLE